MTAKQINAMDAGPDMDRLVAEAIGIPVQLINTDGADNEPVRADTTDELCGLAFRPSSDWNDAMLAAEKFGLFRRWWRHPEPFWQGLRFLTQCDHWCVSEWTDETGIGYKVVASGKTGPLAICRAILANAHTNQCPSSNSPSPK